MQRLLRTLQLVNVRLSQLLQDVTLTDFKPYGDAVQVGCAASPVSTRVFNFYFIFFFFSRISFGSRAHGTDFAVQTSFTMPAGAYRITMAQGGKHLVQVGCMLRVAFL